MANLALSPLRLNGGDQIYRTREVEASLGKYINRHDGVLQPLKFQFGFQSVLQSVSHGELDTGDKQR